MWLTTPDNSRLWYYRVSNTKTIRPKNRVYILLHGLGGDAFGLEPLALAILQQDPDAVIDAYDLRGHGYSSHQFSTTFPTLWDAYAQDVTAILSHTDYAASPICVVGHSMGGIILKEFLSKKQTVLRKKATAWVTITTPQYTHQLPFFLGSSRFWYKRVCQYTSQHHPVQKHRTSAYHLFYKDTHDFWLPRIWSDARWTGHFMWLLLFLSCFGWTYSKTTNDDRAHDGVALRIYGQDDLIVPVHIHSRLEHSQQVTIAGNHIIVFSAFKTVGRIIATFAQKNLPTHL